MNNQNNPSQKTNPQKPADQRQQDRQTPQRPGQVSENMEKNRQTQRDRDNA